ncbi:hypothetical protein ADUPG1_011697 [Aduncisulcus paluster]|uniref:Uncharacterized protein n=1 Tax=Aduncisulcus paluster TaxID=2918883 RepID=A0ABQ5JWS2_9EUKA|nr:hypothetical protein ADUPG1_011697 [Aduncisulcus paluster]
MAKPPLHPKNNEKKTESSKKQRKEAVFHAIDDDPSVPLLTPAPPDAPHPSVPFEGVGPLVDPIEPAVTHEAPPIYPDLSHSHTNISLMYGTMDDDF